MGSMLYLQFTFITVSYFFIVVSSWSPPVSNPNHRRLVTGMMSSTSTSEDVEPGGSLLVSQMHKIGLVDDESSKLRLLLASQSPRRQEILVGVV